MAIRSGGGSTVASNTARSRALMATRKRLNADTERGGPQAPTRTQPQPVPPPQAPAQQPAGGDRAAMLTQTEEFLSQQGARRRGQMPPSTNQRPIQPVSARPGATDRLTEQVAQLGAEGRATETQFFRLAGREGTPRELSIFRGRLELERQLNRPPTESELKMWMARSSSLGPIINPVVEAPQAAPGRA